MPRFACSREDIGRREKPAVVCEGMAACGTVTGREGGRYNPSSVFYADGRLCRRVREIFALDSFLEGGHREEKSPAGGCGGVAAGGRAGEVGE